MLPTLYYVTMAEPRTNTHHFAQQPSILQQSLLPQFYQAKITSVTHRLFQTSITDYITTMLKAMLDAVFTGSTYHSSM